MEKSWSERLKEFREIKGWTQEDMYIFTDISINTIKNWESRRTIPDIKTRKKLRDMFEQVGMK